MKKWKLDRIISVATLVSSLLAIFLVLKKPQPVAPPLPAAVAATKADSFQQKLEQLDEPKQPGQSPAEVRVSSDEISAALAQAAGAIPLSSLGTSGFHLGSVFAGREHRSGPAGCQGLPG